MGGDPHPKPARWPIRVAERFRVAGLTAGVPAVRKHSQLQPVGRVGRLAEASATTIRTHLLAPLAAPPTWAAIPSRAPLVVDFY